MGKHTKEMIDCEFNDSSIDFRVLHFHGKNYRLKIPQLNDMIDPAASKFKVKSNSVTIELVKKKNKSWPDLKPTKSLVKAAEKAGKKGEEEGDPSASLMGMMKELYETGDDNVKRTIAESWSKAS